MTNPFINRSIKKAQDFTIDERRYLFNQIKYLKQLYSEFLITRTGSKTLDMFRILDPLYGVYEWIGENSTRTKESFWNAGQFHGIKYRSFNESMSSTKKGETIEDTINTFIGNDAQTFIIRSRLEGICRWLELTGEAFASRNGFNKPSFINAGDGKHEHPTQEFLDEFSFWEDNSYKTDNIHVALIGDLHNGRTIHSKVDGLNFFDNVKVDLVAPEEISMPAHYIERMKNNGFEVSIFENLEEYILSGIFADKWYFTRLQVERMDYENEFLLKSLHKKISYNLEIHNKYSHLVSKVGFYHPLPDDSKYPVIPRFVKETALNRFENQFINGRYSRIILLAAIAGKIGNEFEGEPFIEPQYSDDFITIIENPKTKRKKINRGIKPINNGIFIDHVMKGYEPKDIWNYLNRIRERLNFDSIGGMGVYTSESDEIPKGILAIENHNQLSESELKILGAIAPGCTINYIKDSKVITKTRTQTPPRIYSIKGTACKNRSCISSSENEAESRFIFDNKKKDTYICEYCDTPHHIKEIWE